MMKAVWTWEDLKELKGMELVEVVEWFVAHGEKKEDLEWDDCHTPIDVLLEDEEEQEFCSLYVGGYWMDEVPVIEFEEGIVVCWYRDEAWD